MAWNDSLRRVNFSVVRAGRQVNFTAIGASFRGVPFFIESHGLKGGRRLVQHQFPNIDLPFNEDLGRMARQFSVSAYLTGENVLAQRDALLAALEAAGPGVLVHPYLGEMQARCGDFSLKEEQGTGQFCQFDISFVQDTETTPLQEKRVDKAAKAALAANAARENGKKVAAQKMSVKGLMGTVLEKCQDAVKLAVDSVAKVKKTAQAAAEYQQKVQALVVSVEYLLQDSKSLAIALADLVTYTPEPVAAIVAPASLDGNTELDTQAAQENALARGEAVISATPAQIFAELLEMADGQQQAAAEPGNAQGQEKQADGFLQAQAQLLLLCAVSAAIETAATEQIFESLQDAQAAQDKIRASVDTLLDWVDDEQYKSVLEMGAAADAAFNELAETLRPVVKFEAQKVTSSLQVAGQIYANAAQADQLEARNAWRHPGFIPAAAIIEAVAP